jgi:hypothetical protein
MADLDLTTPPHPTPVTMIVGVARPALRASVGLILDPTG